MKRRTIHWILPAFLLAAAWEVTPAALVDQNGWGRIDRLDSLIWEPAGIPALSLLADDAYSGIQPLPFVVSWGGQSYSHFNFGTNGDVELLNAGDTPVMPGFGFLGGLPSAATFLLTAYDDLVGRVTYEDKGDRVVFSYSVITYADDETFSSAIEFLNTFQTVLHADGTVEWNFLEGNFSGFGYDLASGIQLAGQGSLLAVTGDIPGGVSFRFTPVPLPAPLLLLPPLLLFLLGRRRVFA